MNFKKILIILIVLFYSIFPYYLGYINTPSDQNFTGFLLESMDNPTYISKMDDNYNFKYINTYSINRNKGSYIFLYYSITGLIANKLNIPTIYAFHLFRVILNVILVLFIYKLYSTISEEKNVLPLTFFSLFVGANDCLIYLLSKFLGFESYRGTNTPEFFASTSMIYIPHFTLVFIFQILFILSLLNYEKNIIKNIKIGLILLLISLIHPYTAVIMGFIGIVYLFTNKKINYGLILWVLIPMPYLIYLVKVFNSDLVLFLWKENMLHITSIKEILLYWSIPFIVWILIVIVKRDFNNFFYIWSAFLLPILFLPSKYQIRLGEGLFIPLSFLIGNYIINKYNNKIFKVLLFIILCSSSLYYLIEPLDYKNSYYRYLDKELIETFTYIDKKYTNEKVFSDMLIGNMLPMYTDSNSIYGHKDESIFQNKIEKKLKNLYNGINIDNYLIENSTDIIIINKQYMTTKINTNFIVTFENEDFIVYKNKKRRY